MKKKIIVAVILSLTAVLIIAFGLNMTLHISNCDGIAEPDAAIEDARSGYPPIPNETAIWVSYEGTAVLVQKGDDIALVDFIEVINEGTKEDITTFNGRKVRLLTPQWRIKYRYRYFESGKDREEPGEGELFERYERHGIKDGVAVVDKGGRLLITAGNITLRWSSKDDSSGWLYFSNTEYKVGFLSDVGYEGQSLSTW